MGIGREFIELMNILNYNFSDISYLEAALTHSSYSNEMKSKGIRVNSNEELEFLGDAVLELVISEVLYDRYGKQGEGILTKMRQALVCEGMLAKIATEINLGVYLNVGTGEELSEIRTRSKVLADALEAVIAAVYLDDKLYNGYGNYRRVIISLFDKHISDINKNGYCDYKTMLYQFVEKNQGSLLTYKYNEEGPDHEKVFTASAYINNNLVGEGRGQTKRAAEMQAAQRALMLFGIISDKDI